MSIPLLLVVVFGVCCLLGNTTQRGFVVPLHTTTCINIHTQARNLEFLNDCLDDLMSEQQKITNHARAAQRQQREFMHWLNKRRQENIARRYNTRVVYVLHMMMTAGWSSTTSTTQPLDVHHIAHTIHTHGTHDTHNHTHTHHTTHDTHATRDHIPGRLVRRPFLRMPHTSSSSQTSASLTTTSLPTRLRATVTK